jgi:hypothetical protein
VTSADSSHESRQPPAATSAHCETGQRASAAAPPRAGTGPGPPRRPSAGSAWPGQCRAGPVGQTVPRRVTVPGGRAAVAGAFHRSECGGGSPAEAGGRGPAQRPPTSKIRARGRQPEGPGPRLSHWHHCSCRLGHNRDRDRDLGTRSARHGVAACQAARPPSSLPLLPPVTVGPGRRRGPCCGGGGRLPGLELQCGARSISNPKHTFWQIQMSKNESTDISSMVE